MKLFFKLDRKAETINNISIDDKCFPVIGGVHPYNASSPLTSESALWFKTLVVDAIYVDCDRCHIFWTSVQNDVGPDVVLRGSCKQQNEMVPYSSDFIPKHANPLFKDTSLFDFDASLKEMMGKCKEVAGKLMKQSHLVADINSRVANLLHVYILPSINFSKDDLYALSRTRCLIEERRLRADSEIENKAQGKHLLKVSLDNLKENLIHSYSFESESYIRTCDPAFLKVFLKKIEEDSTNLNLNLVAQQSKVNWAKDHPKEYKSDDIIALQKKRDEVYKEVDKLIKVREGLRNVVSRKEKFKSKRKRSKQTRLQHIDGCFQSIFVEISRRWEMDEKFLNQLINDSVNISGAREATLSAILELDMPEERNSDRSTHFEPGDFSCYWLKEDKSKDKTNSWLTLEERVSNKLKDTSSYSYKRFDEGCTLIISQIDLALSEFHLAGGDRCELVVTDFDQIQRDVDSCQMRKGKGQVTKEILDRRSGFVLNENTTDVSKFCMMNNHLDVNDMKYASMMPLRREGSLKPLASLDTQNQGKSLSVGILNSNSEKEKEFLALFPDHFSSQRRSKDSSYESISDSVEFSESDFVKNENMKASNHLALKQLMHSIDNVKSMMREHFRDVIKWLETELEDCSEDTVVIDSVYIDSRELIWKAYERHFSEKVLTRLVALYESSLVNGISSTYDSVSQMSMQDLLEGDKILSLFFENQMDNLQHHSLFIDGASENADRISMARTASDFGFNIADCSIKDLYALANADSADVVKRFQLDDGRSSVVSSSSSESGASVKTADLFDDEDDHSDCENASVSTETSNSKQCEGFKDVEEKDEGTTSLTAKELPSLKMTGTKERSSSSCSDSVLEKESYCMDVMSSKRTVELLDRVLSPFRKQMEKCIRVTGILDKVRYLSKAIEGLNKDISKLCGGEHQSACDDIITMLVLALSNMPKDVFVRLYVNLNMLIDVLPKFLSGSLCEYNLVSLVASYDYLKNRNASQQIVRRDSTNFGP